MNLRALTPPPPRTLAVLLIFLTVVAYLPAISAGYVWDDDTLLTGNPQMRSLAGLAQIWLGEHSRDYTPLTLTAFWLEWRLWGSTPAGYHVVNILLHALCALLLWRVLERLRVPGAWLAALLFAIHPVNVASAAWVAELKNTLSSAFFLGSILSYLAARDEKRRSLYVCSIALFLLAVLSKGAVVTMPAVLLLCVLWKDRKLIGRDLLQVIPFAAIALAAALLTIRYQARAPHYGLIPDSLDYRIARAGASIWHYLAALAWPSGMSPMRPQWLQNLHSPFTCLPAVAAATAWALLFWKRKSWGRPLLFAYTYYLLMLLPVLGFVWMTLMQETPGTDWWQYMAAPGIFACIAAGFVTASRKSPLALPLLALLMVPLVIQTWRRESIYQSMEPYCRAVTAENPHAWTLQNNLGIMLKRQGRFAEAEACYHQALRDNPGYVEVHINLGNLLATSGDTAGAQAEFLRAAQMRPGDPTAMGSLANLGGTLAAQGQPAEAEACFRDAIALAPDSVPLRIELCEVLVAQRKKEEALKVCDDVDQLAHKSGDSNALAAAAKLRQDCEAANPPH